MIHSPVSQKSLRLIVEPISTRSILALSYVQEPNFMVQFW